MRKSSFIGEQIQTLGMVRMATNTGAKALQFIRGRNQEVLDLILKPQPS